MRLNILFASLLVFISAAFFLLSAQDEAFNQIDGFTSPSKRHSLKVHSGKVYKNRAELIWEEYWENDNDVLVYTVMWGTDSGQYTDTLNLQPYEEETATPITLESLVENTEYYGEFYRDYNRKLFNVRFRFNTPPLPTVAPVIDSTAVGCRVPPFSISTGESITSVEVFSIDGRCLCRIPVDKPSRIQSAVQSVLVPGMYIINFRGKTHQLLSSEKVLVSN